MLQISLHYTKIIEQNCHINIYTTGIGVMVWARTLQVWEQHSLPVSIPVPDNRSECFLIYKRVFFLQIPANRLFWGAVQRKKINTCKIKGHNIPYPVRCPWFELTRGLSLWIIGCTHASSSSSSSSLWSFLLTRGRLNQWDLVDLSTA